MPAACFVRYSQNVDQHRHFNRAKFSASVFATSVAITFIYAGDVWVSVVVRQNVDYFNGVSYLRQGVSTVEITRLQPTPVPFGTAEMSNI
jgi:hypothetical protein